MGKAKEVKTFYFNCIFYNKKMINCVIFDFLSFHIRGEEFISHKIDYNDRNFIICKVIKILTFVHFQYNFLNFIIHTNNANFEWI
jgi:hypothetical protein